jgi:diguanylate cyclase (GGDEF)-like protein
LAIIDIDHFKAVNDQWGHVVGDQAIQFVAQRMNSYFYEPVCIARLGGDEFAVVLSTSDEEAARGQLDGFRKQLGAQVATNHEIELTVSIGIALSDGQASARDLLTAADQAMYQSKNAGRNQVTAKTI